MRLLLLPLLILASACSSPPLGGNASPTPLIGTRELAAKIQRGETPTLLDTREPDEYHISHLPGARHIGFSKFHLKTLQNLPQNTPIIVYCSVGYRSGKIGQKLTAAGYTHVHNLRGGIFAWANQGHPLLDHENNPTKTVHGYNRKWSEILHPTTPITLGNATPPPP